MHTILVNANALLKGFIPTLAILNFTGLILLTAWNWKSIRSYFSGIDTDTWIMIVRITVFAFIIRLIIPSHQHIVFTDEYDYMLAAKTFLQNGNIGHYGKSIAWPMIIAASFRIFGIANQVAIHTSMVMGSLTVIAIFLLSYAITKKTTASLTAAVIFAVLPHHVRWSACAETNVPSLLFIMVALVYCFLYYELRTTPLLLLVTISLAFISQFRPENFVYTGLFVCGCMIFKSKRKHNRWAWLAALALLIVLALPDFIQVLVFHTSTNWIPSDTQGMATGNNFSLMNLLLNSLHYGWELFNPLFLPFPVMILAFFGMRRLRVKNRKVYQFLLIWFGLLWVAYFSIWLQTLGGRVRLYISFYPIFVVLACYGLEYLRERLSGKALPGGRPSKLPGYATAAVIALCVLHLPIAYFSLADSQGRLETNIATMARADIPETCFIIANKPVVLESTTDLPVFPTLDFLHDIKVQDMAMSSFDCVLFFEDLTCFQHPLPECAMMKEQFTMVPYKSYRDNKSILFQSRMEEQAEYTFYKITGKAK